MNDMEDMEMPVVCQHCGEWFDLNDGCGSDRWYPGTVICEECSRIEEREIELDNEIEDCNNRISDAEWEIENASKELQTLKDKKEKLENQKEDRRNL